MIRLNIKPTVMPEVEACYPYLADAEDAINRAMGSWNTTQLEDALRSVEYLSVWLGLLSNTKERMKQVPTETSRLELNRL